MPIIDREFLPDRLGKERKRSSQAFILAAMLVAILLIGSIAGLMIQIVNSREPNSSETPVRTPAEILYTTHSPISIVGDGGFKHPNGVVGGSGTVSDPYIIDGWQIIGTSPGSCIEIRDTTAHFIISNCNLQAADAIFLSNVANGSVTNVPAWGGALWIENSTDISVNKSSFDGLTYGVYISNSVRVSIVDCTVTGPDWGLYVDLSRDVLYESISMGMANVGLSLHHSWGVVCSNISFVSSSYVAVIDGLSHSSLSECNFSIYYGGGVLLTNSDNFTIARNDIATFDVPQWIENWGVLASDSENVSIYSNTIQARITGIIVQRCIDTIVEDNSVSYGSWGISDSGSISSFVMNNTISSMSNGISSSGSTSCIVWGNTMTVTNTAISMDRSNGSAVIDNSATTATWPNYAVLGDSCWDLLIMNNTRLDPSYVYLDHCVNAMIFNNDLRTGALGLDYCQGTILLNNTIVSSDTAVSVRWSTETYVVDNTFHAPKWAVRMEASQGGGAYDNLFPGENKTDLYGIEFSYSRDMVASGNIFGSFESGVGIAYSTNITVYENDFTLSSVNLFNSPGCLILNNTFRGGGGVGALYNCSYSEIVGNNFLDKGMVSLQDALGLGLFENVFVGGGVAIWGWSIAAYDSHLITSDNLVNGEPILQILDASGVSVNGTDVGELIVVNSEFVNISGLDISDCYMGMLIAYCANVTIENNTLANDWIGVRLFNSVDVLVDHNHFISDSTGVDTQYSEARFNLSYPGGGNYWSSYTGVDLYHGPGQNISGPDGYGDTPYDWYGVVVDHYPILGPYVSYPPVAAFTYLPVAGDINTLYVFNASSSHNEENPNGALQVRWDWNGDGTWDTSWSSNMSAEHIFASPGTYTVRLEVRDSLGATNITELQVTIAEEIPEFGMMPFVVITFMAVIVLAGESKRKKKS